MRKSILSLSIATMIGSMGAANAGVVVAVAAQGATTNSGIGWTGLQPLTGAAQATSLVLSAGGVGTALITPYFTAQGGNATVISLVNVDPTNGKAVKVRFRGGSNSDDILDFQVYMSPNDVWNGMVSKNASTGIAEFTTTDKSCTLPAFTSGVAQPFVTARLPSYSTATELANGTSEGYVEIFNMADIPVNTNTNSIYQSILHTAGTPRNCASAALNATFAADATNESAAAFLGFAAPTGMLFGNWTIINVPQTTTFSGSMSAIRAMVGTADGYSNYTLFPQSATAAPTPENSSADPLFNSSISYTSMPTTGATAGLTSAATIAVTAAFYDLPDLSTPMLVAGAGTTSGPRGQAFSLTSALAVNSISNEYATEAATNAQTDWVFSMPTRRYSVAFAYGTSVATGRRLYSSVADATGAAPVTQFFASTNTTLSGDRICVAATGQKFYDRDESSKTSGAVFSPGSVATFNFCGETSVTTFGGKASVLGAVLAKADTGSSAFVNGWGVVNTPNPAGAGSVNIGLPIIGSSFIKLTNAAASAGTSGTYGITSAHRFSK